MAYSTLTNPTEAAARYLEQAGYDPLQQQAVAQGGALLGATGVLDGCAVTAQGSPDTTVAVAAGHVQVYGAQATVAAGNVSGFTAPSAGLRRIDLVVTDKTGAKSRLAGTAVAPADSTHAGPVWPSAFDPTTYAVLAEVTVDAADSTVVAGCIIDKRVPFSPDGMQGAKPAAALFETYPRWLSASNQNVLTSGQPKLVGITLPAGLSVASISWMSATTPHLWSALYDSSLALLRQSTDDTSPTWNANTLKTFTLSSTFTTTYSGFHYVALMSSAASGNTVPTLACYALGSGINNLYNLATILVGNSSSTGQTGTAPNPAGGLTASITLPYAYVS